MTPRNALSEIVEALVAEDAEVCDSPKREPSVTMQSVRSGGIGLTLYAYPNEFVVCVLVNGNMDERIAEYDWQENPVEDVFPSILEDAPDWWATAWSMRDSYERLDNEG